MQRAVAFRSHNVHGESVRYCPSMSAAASVQSSRPYSHDDVMFYLPSPTLVAPPPIAKKPAVLYHALLHGLSDKAGSGTPGDTHFLPKPRPRSGGMQDIVGHCGTLRGRVDLESHRPLETSTCVR